MRADANRGRDQINTPAAGISLSWRNVVVDLGYFALQLPSLMPGEKMAFSGWHVLTLIVILFVSFVQSDINRTGCNRTVDAGDVLANPLLTGFTKGKPYNCWFLVSMLFVSIPEKRSWPASLFDSLSC